jgi:hypothetical protein
LAKRKRKKYNLSTKACGACSIFCQTTFPSALRRYGSLTTIKKSEKEIKISITAVFCCGAR